MATNIPTHNLSEVINGCCAYIDNPDIDTEGLMKYIPAPDFPTGAYIYGLKGVKEAYETGKGRIIMRAKAEIESDDSHDRIVVTEIPYVSTSSSSSSISLTSSRKASWRVSLMSMTRPAARACASLST